MKSADQDDSFDYLFKIVLIGDPGVGKTCIVQRFKKGTFVERHGSTIGVDFTMKTVLVDAKKVKVRARVDFIKNRICFDPNDSGSKRLKLPEFGV